MINPFDSQPLEDEPFFRFYKKIPLLGSMIVAIGSALSSFIPLVNVGFAPFLLSLLLGTLLTVLTYAILKISLAPMILQTEYLQIIANNTKNAVPATQNNTTAPSSEAVAPKTTSNDIVAKQVAAYKDLLDKGVISQETYEKSIAELKNE